MSKNNLSPKYLEQNEVKHHMFENQQIVVKKEKEQTKVKKVSEYKHRFSVRKWQQQNKANLAKGRPAIKLEEKDNDCL